ncbi:MAG: hypothetical protein H7239_03895 [Flavobacterium sp.]|nr:hypothetical protein [Flavobacterium sp.]
MKSNNIKKIAILFLIASLSIVKSYAQNNSKFKLIDKNNSNDNVVMTWNKTTPEQEMKDDVKALAEKGISIKYSNIKRNPKNEITALKVEYTDRKGNKGAMELNNQNPISTIKFFKQGDEIGFGDPSSSNELFSDESFMKGFSNGNDILKQFNFGNGDSQSQTFSFDFPEDGNQSKSSKIIIQKDGKKPLVIENGEVTQGVEDYTKEEIEEIKKNNQVQDNSNSFDFRNQEGLDNFKKQMDKLKIRIEAPKSEKSDIEKT